jgi:hypothetical protein
MNNSVIKPSLLFIFFLITTITLKAQTPTISIKDAPNYINQTVTVCDSVYGTKALDNITFLNFGGNFPKAPLTIVIFKANRSKFPQEPALLFDKKRICITGKITEYKGKLQVVLNEVGQVKIIN